MAETRMALNGRTETEQATRRATGLEFQRRFTDGKVAPFDKVEWERRTALIGNDKGQVIFRQENVEVPKSWSMTATNIVASKYFHGKPNTPERETSVRQLIGRVVDTIVRWGEEGGYFATPDSEECISRRADSPARRTEDGLQFAGVVQRGRAGEAAMLRLLHQLRPGQHGLDHEPGEDRRHALQVGLRHGNEFLHAARQPRIAFGRRHRLRPGELHEGLRRVCGRDQERRQDAPRRQDGDPQRGSSGHHGVHREQDEGRAQGARADRAGLQLRDRRRSVFLRLLPECEPFGSRDGRFHARRRRRSRLVDAQRERRRAGGEVPRARPAARNGGIGMAVRRSRHAVRHDHQSLAHLQVHGPHQCLESVLGIHVPRRHGLQSRVAEPAEIPRDQRPVRHRGFPPRRGRHDHCAGNSGGQRELSHARKSRAIRTTIARSASATPTSARC